MDRIDFLKLMKDGLAGIADSDLEILVQSLLRTEKELKKLDDRSLDVRGAVMDFLDDMFCNLSREMVKRRERIVRLANKKHANPKLQSEYCLSILKIEFNRWHRRRTVRQILPYNEIVDRQVHDHLKKLRRKGVLRSQNILGTSSENILAVLWGLSEWGPEMKNRARRLTRNKLIEALPDIPKGEGGKGLFRYNKILPEYLPHMLTLSDAPLGTPEIKFAVRAKLGLTPQATISMAMCPENEGRMVRVKDENVTHRYDVQDACIFGNDERDETQIEAACEEPRRSLTALIKREKTEN